MPHKKAVEMKSISIYRLKKAQNRNEFCLDEPIPHLNTVIYQPIVIEGSL